MILCKIKKELFSSSFHNIKILVLLFFAILIYTLNGMKSITLENKSNNYMSAKVRLTHYTGNKTGSGKTTNDFTLNNDGWYFYKQENVNYLVVATATTYCRDDSDHCGVSVSEHGFATKIPFYKYYDTMVLKIGEKNYNAIILDSCGACMWGDRDTEGEKIDVLVDNTVSNFVAPDIYKTYIVSVNGAPVNEDYSDGDNTSDSNNKVSDYSTTYNGDYEKGYIFFSQKDNLLSGTRADKIESKINTIIKNIFNKTNYLENNNSKNDYEIPTNNPDAKSWKQYDSSWGHIPLGNSSENIKSAGCLATSVSIQIKLSGTSLTTENFNPGTFVKYLNQHSGFEGALFKWSGAWKGLAPKFDFVSKDALPSSKEAKINKIREILNSGYYPVMCVKKNCGHWVAVTGVTSDNINIADPGSTSTTVFPKYNAIANDNTLKVAYFKLSN